MSMHDDEKLVAAADRSQREAAPGQRGLEHADLIPDLDEEGAA